MAHVSKKKGWTESKLSRHKTFIRGVTGGATPRERFVGSERIEKLADRIGKAFWKKYKSKSLEELGRKNTIREALNPEMHRSPWRRRKKRLKMTDPRKLFGSPKT